MPTRFQRFGNDLYTGALSIDFVGHRRRKIWYSIAAVLIIASVLIPIFHRGFNFGIDFVGGSQFSITQVKTTDQGLARSAVASVDPSITATVTTINGNAVQVQTEQLTSQKSLEVGQALATAYKVPVADVTSTFIGPSWGADVSKKAIQGVVVFLLLAFIAMALYFRTWKMSAAAILSLLHDMIITAGVYAAVGFEITPATMIGFLTILAYSLYDTVVVFDQINENTVDDATKLKRTFAESVNLAVNQTLVRSINTGVIAVLPVAAILFIGTLVFGADTLRDISLSLFIGIILGTYSTIFIASPLYAEFREGEDKVAKHDKRVLALRAKAASSEQPELVAE
ncbi:MAG TPA: protein translocase subunit SecF [Microbacteriaceae bacterium]|nr:protein translocase subunit SecF [Microbacteriaceae bacterium]